MHELTGLVAYHVFDNALKLQLEYRGLYAAQTDWTYLAPWGTWNDFSHEFTLMAQLAF